MNKFILSLLSTLGILLLGVCLLQFVFDGEAVLENMSQISTSLWVLLLALSLFNYVLRYLRWSYYLKKDMPIGLGHVRHFVIYMAGFALTTTPGKAGEALRCFYLHNYNISLKTTMSAFIVERLMDLWVIILMALAVLSLFTQEQYLLLPVVLLVIALVFLTLKLPVQSLEQGSLLRKFPRFIRQALKFFFELIKSAQSLLTMKITLMSLLIGLLAWGAEGIGLFFLVQSFAPEFNAPMIAIGIYGAAMLLGAFSFLPGGVGGAEACMIFLLMKTGLGTTEAVAITLICRLATLWFAVVIGAICTAALTITGTKPILNKVKYGVSK